MSFTFKLVIFWICVIAILAFVRMYPRSLPARFLLSWQGPKPKVGESETLFLLKYGLWALRWFAQLAAVELIGAYFFSAKMGTSTITMVIFGFTVPILTGMAFLGSILILVQSLLHRFHRIKKVFKVPPGDFIAEEDNATN